MIQQPSYYQNLQRSIGEMKMEISTKRIIETYHQSIKDYRKKAMKSIMMVSIILVVLVPLLWTLMANKIFNVLFYSVLGLLFISLIILVLVDTFYVSEKPLYHYLIPKMIDQINYDESKDITYEAYPNQKETVNISGLFPKHSHKMLRAGFQFYGDSSHHISLYDIHCYTQTDKSYVNHVNGYYAVITGYKTQPLQIRTKGKPSPSLIKYQQHKEESTFKLYSQSLILSEEDQRLISLYPMLCQLIPHENLYLSSKDGKIFIAFDIKKFNRRIKQLDQAIYKKYLNQLIKWIHQLSDFSNQLL